MVSYIISESALAIIVISVQVVTTSMEEIGETKTVVMLIVMVIGIKITIL